MKKLSTKERTRMIRALDFALGRIRIGYATALCFGLYQAENEGICTRTDKDYLCKWIAKMLKGEDNYLETDKPAWMYSKEERYSHRLPWVKWMINHLKETS
jgi:hypothetical protein